MTIADTLYETLIQFEGTPYRIKDNKFTIERVFQDHFVLLREDGCYYMIRYDYVKLIKTNASGTAIDWIVFDDNRQLPG